MLAQRTRWELLWIVSYDRASFKLLPNNQRFPKVKCIKPNQVYIPAVISTYSLLVVGPCFENSLSTVEKKTGLVLDLTSFGAPLLVGRSVYHSACNLWIIPSLPLQKIPDKVTWEGAFLKVAAGKTCISSKFGHQLAPLALVLNLLPGGA